MKDNASEFYRSRLSGSDVKLYDSILQATQNFEARLSLGRPISPRAGLALYNRVRNDHPELIHLENDIRIVSSLLGSQMIFRYGMSRSSYSDLYKEMNAKGDEILPAINTSIMGENEVIQSIHDYLVTHVQYNIEALQRNRITSKETNAHGALLYGNAVCHGYAQAMKYLCDKMGIFCIVVIGKSNFPSTKQQIDHAWNIVKAIGYFQHIDVTWDSNQTTSHEVPCRDYFMLNDEHILLDHVYDASSVPKCPDEPCNYYHANNAEVTSLSDIDHIVSDAAFMDANVFGFRVNNWSISQDKLIGYAQDSIMKHYSSASGKYQYRYNYNEYQNTYWFYVEVK